MSNPVRTLITTLTLFAVALPVAAATTTPANPVQAGLIDPATGYTYAGAPSASSTHKTVAKKQVISTVKKAKTKALIVKKKTKKTKKTGTKPTTTASSTTSTRAQ
jgi:hypothetical protein